MASSDEKPETAQIVEPGPTLPGNPENLGSKLVNVGAQMLQSIKPVQQMNMHACTIVELNTAKTLL
jgi:hypothetical protein